MNIIMKWHYSSNDTLIESTRT